MMSQNHGAESPKTDKCSEEIWEEARRLGEEAYPGGSWYPFGKGRGLAFARGYETGYAAARAEHAAQLGAKDTEIKDLKAVVQAYLDARNVVESGQYGMERPSRAQRDRDLTDLNRTSTALLAALHP